MFKIFKMGRSRKWRRSLMVICWGILLGFLYLTLSTGLSRNEWDQWITHNLTTDLSNVENGTSYKKETIVIAAVICSKPGDTENVVEAAAMIKSTIVSWHLYKFNADLEFHLFMEHEKAAEYLRFKLKKYGHPNINLNIRLVFHTALDAMPAKYQNEMNKQLRCTYVRIFLPDVLPNVDSVLYLDTDIIITGNLSVLWNNLQKMSGEQLVGGVQDFVYKSPNASMEAKDKPVLPSKGLNVGVLLMNLTRMREYGFTEKILRLYNDYTKFVPEMNDQQLINAFLYSDPGLLYQLPCQFNVVGLHCPNGKLCSGVEMDPDGIQVIHGAGSQFIRGNYWFLIYHHYRVINITYPELDWQRHFIDPIRTSYSNWNDPHCNDVLVKQLFKSVSTSVQNSPGLLHWLGF